MKRIALTFLALGLIGAMSAPAVAQESKDQEKKEDSFDKAGKKTEGAMKKAGDATEKGLDAAGKGVGAAVEHTGRGVTTGAKATAKGLGKAGEAVADVFTDDSKDNGRMQEAQRALQAKGYYQGAIDGIAGPRTQSGLREFQQDQKIEVSGKLDGETAKRLGLE
jgi:peptidoglycan hydrolase-like protein with peptidoglycan-binding domain